MTEHEWEVEHDAIFDRLQDAAFEGSKQAKFDLRVARARFFGEVPCGEPVRLGEASLTWVTLAEVQLPDGWHEGCYLLSAKGRSMEGWRIPAGAYVAVDPELPASSGDVVIATVNGETTSLRSSRR